MAGNSAGSVAVDLVLNDRGFNNSVKNNLKSTESAFSSTFKNIGAIVATAFAVDKVVEFGKSCVQAASDAQAAWTGLNSIVQGTGNSFDVAKNFLTKFTQDGLVGIEDAATAYKNLLARGYDTTQIEKVMTALKDAAAFGRQSSYTLSGAVVSATEGLKNENSILVDNAGVTKNVAKMWEEYAASIGKTYNQLTQQEKIQAEVNGILQETKFQTGDAATYTDTFAGRMQVLKGAFASMQTAIGKVVAPIVGLFVPAITSAINAVTAFFTRLQGVLSIFGLEFPDVVQKTTTGLDNMGTSAVDAAKEIAGTGTAAKKAAKEANKAFSSVDEINVINTKKPDASSGAGGGSAVSSAGSAAVAGNDAISSAIGSTAENIMKYIAPLQAISFDNLINAFSRLKEALAPIGETIWKGLEWAYFNILVPLAAWTIQDFLPAFLDTLSGALTIVNPLLTSFGNVFEPVWNNVLQPLLSWTGSTIVTILEGVAGALTTIGTWMSDNQSVVDGIVASLTTFFGLWKLTELMAFVQMSGGIAGAFTTITTALKGATLAKLADKAETVALTALYAKDFIVSVAQGTAALVKNAAQWALTTGAKVAATAATVASTAATTAATAATWLFNTAMAVLTSPITLVVAAIAALIAIVVLLVKNWDTVKEVAGKCWDAIKSAWNAAGTWFNTKVVTPVANFFKNMWNNLKTGASTAWTNIKNAFSSVGTFFGNIWNTIKTKFTNIGQKIGDAVGGAFKKAFNSVMQTIENVANAPINAINSLREIINKVPGINIGRLNTFSLPRLAQGGWVGANNPQLAIIGDNTREGEIVAPESKIREQVKQAIAEMGAAGQRFVMDLNLKIQTDDGRTIIKKINDVTIQDGYASIII